MYNLQHVVIPAQCSGPGFRGHGSVLLGRPLNGRNGPIRTYEPWFRMGSPHREWVARGEFKKGFDVTVGLCCARVMTPSGLI